VSKLNDVETVETVEASDEEIRHLRETVFLICRATLCHKPSPNSFDTFDPFNFLNIDSFNFWAFYSRKFRNLQSADCGVGLALSASEGKRQC